MRVAVAGGAGLVGGLLVLALKDIGHESVVLARATGVDITAGTGLERALRGANTVVDVSNVTTTEPAGRWPSSPLARGTCLRPGREPGCGTTSRCPSWVSTAWITATTRASGLRSG